MAKEQILTEKNVKVISSFYDLQNDNKLRKIGDVFLVDKKRANKLVELKLVVIVG